MITQPIVDELRKYGFIQGAGLYAGKIFLIFLSKIKSFPIRISINRLQTEINKIRKEVKEYERRHKTTYYF